MQKTIHLILKPEDSDLLGWKASLPHRTLNKTVNEILLAESKSEIAAIPFEFLSQSLYARPLELCLRNNKYLRLLFLEQYVFSLCFYLTS